MPIHVPLINFGDIDYKSKILDKKKYTIVKVEEMMFKPRTCDIQQAWKPGVATCAQAISFSKTATLFWFN